MNMAIIGNTMDNPKEQTEKGLTGKCVIRPRHKNASYTTLLPIVRENPTLLTSLTYDQRPQKNNQHAEKRAVVSNLVFWRYYYGM